MAKERKPAKRASKPLSEQIKNLRTGLKLTQTQAAEKLGVSVRTYQNWEQGRAEPDRFVVRHIEETLGKLNP